MTQAREKWDSENDFRHCYGHFFANAILKVTWSKVCSKFLLKNHETHWQQDFERHPIIQAFTDRDQDTC